MTLKTQEYLGIQIDLDREKELSEFSINTLQNRYFWENETYAQQAFARASVFGATYKGQTDYDLAQRLYNYASLCWFMFSTPILSNGGTTRGLPISCFLNYVPDSRFGLSDHYFGVVDIDLIDRIKNYFFYIARLIYHILIPKNLVNTFFTVSILFNCLYLFFGN